MVGKSTRPLISTSRRQGDAHQVAKIAYPFACCAVCGLQLQTVLAVAHLNHDPTDNDADNLAYMCWSHHWMHDAGLYPTDAIKLLRNHWQKTQGKPSHAARMKDAGKKAAMTRKLWAAGRKAATTRRTKATVNGKA